MKEIKRDSFFYDRTVVVYTVEENNNLFLGTVYTIKFKQLEEDGFFNDETPYFNEVFFRRSQNIFDSKEKAVQKFYAIKQKIKKIYDCYGN